MNKGKMKRLGNYIRKVYVRNLDIKVMKLLTDIIFKDIISAIANTIRTNFYISKNYYNFFEYAI